MIPYPTTDLSPSEALRALRAAGAKLTRDAMLHPSTWAALVAIWASKRNAAARDAYDVRAWATLVRELNLTRSYRAATRKPNLSIAARLARALGARGVAMSAEQEKRSATKRTRRNATVEAVTRLVETARLDAYDADRIELDASTMLGALLADKSNGIILLGREGHLVGFDRARITRVADTLRASHTLGEMKTSFNATAGKECLCIRWRNGKGGLDVRPMIAIDHGVKALAVVFPWDMQRSERVVVVAPNVEPASKPVARAVATDVGMTRTQRAWAEFKKLRPIVERLEVDLRAGRIDAPRAVALLDDARACKPTSWGSVLKRWREALDAARQEVA